MKRAATKRAARPPVQKPLSRFDVNNRTVTLKVERRYCYFCAQMQEGCTAYLRKDGSVIVQGCGRHPEKVKGENGQLFRRT